MWARLPEQRQKAAARDQESESGSESKFGNGTAPGDVESALEGLRREKGPSGVRNKTFLRQRNSRHFGSGFHFLVETTITIKSGEYLGVEGAGAGITFRIVEKFHLNRMTRR